MTPVKSYGWSQVGYFIDILITVTLCGSCFYNFCTFSGDAPHINHKARDLCLVIDPLFVIFEALVKSYGRSQVGYFVEETRLAMIANTCKGRSCFWEHRGLVSG